MVIIKKIIKSYINANSMLDVSQIVGAIIFCTILFLRGKRIVWKRVKRLDCFVSLNKSLYKGDCNIVCGQ